MTQRVLDLVGAPLQFWLLSSPASLVIGLTNRIVLVTGASQGIEKVTARVVARGQARLEAWCG